MSQPLTGTFEVTQVFANGTAQIQDGAIIETVNIRWMTLLSLRRTYGMGSEYHAPVVRA
jgi:hypothetical protein